MKRYLVTGAAGYIGSHFLQRALLHSGYSDSEFLCIDQAEQPLWIVELCRNFPSRLVYLKSNLREARFLGDRLKGLSGVFHFAGLKDVVESFKRPKDYYKENVVALLELLQSAQFCGNGFFCFSSSASVYGETPVNQPVSETHILNPLSPYSRSKAMAEQILSDVACMQRDSTKFVSLRYFNPVGGSKGIETPFQSSLFDQICINIKNDMPIKIFGNDHRTKDGTCVRDFIDIDDLVDAHLRLGLSDLCLLEEQLNIFNVGSNHTSSVAEVVNQMGEIYGRKLVTAVCKKRVGDIPYSSADGTKLKSFLNWSPKQDLRSMCEHHLDWRI
ncbi:GDP-mannose 4,6-dehydratase [Litoricolaceae bacterium]|nr:GDP-mannose 4,6-dehydratase [Litorivicinaceae bacterium]